MHMRMGNIWEETALSRPGWGMNVRTNGGSRTKQGKRGNKLFEEANSVGRGNDRLEVLYYEEGVINWKFYNMNEEWVG